MHMYLDLLRYGLVPKIHAAFHFSRSDLSLHNTCK
jgi:hypothetical protein